MSLTPDHGHPAASNYDVVAVRQPSESGTHQLAFLWNELDGTLLALLRLGPDLLHAVLLGATARHPGLLRQQEHDGPIHDAREDCSNRNY